jgi:hypothetical protein
VAARFTTQEATCAREVNPVPALVLSTEDEVSRDEAEACAVQLAAAGSRPRPSGSTGWSTYWMAGAVPRSRELHDTVAFLAKRPAHRPTRTG